MDLVERYCPGCGAACAPGVLACGACGMSLKVTRKLDEKILPPPPALRLATHLQSLQLFQNRYRIVRQVGVGGFGAVYEAMDTWQTRKVAIKEIGLGGLSAQQVIEATGAFNREVQMLSSLRHPGIPRMYEQLTDAEHWYLVMEFIAGQTLEDVLAQASHRRLPLERVLSIGLQICVILEYLHRQQPAVIFRDIKPANIMLTPQGNLYLIDFGVARRYQRSKARDTVAFGSPGYASPEQYGRAQTTPLSDIYSLGALLYCLVSGDDPSEHPFKFPPLRLYGVEGIRELDALIQRMVASDPLQRLQTPGAELRRIQQLYYQSARRSAPIWIPPRGQTPPSLVAISSSGQHQQQVMMNAPAVARSQQPAGKKTSRRRLLVGSLVTGTLLVFGAGVTWAASTRNVSKVPAGAQPSVQIPVDNGFPTQPADAIEPSSTDLHPLVPNDGATYWSADLRYAVVAHTSQNRLDVYATRPPEQLTSVSATYYAPVIQWAPDNSKFLSIPDNVVWNARTGTKLYTLPPSVEWGYMGCAAWSPDGKYLMASASDYYSRVGLGLFEAETGSLLFQKSLQGLYVAGCIAWSPDSRFVAFPNSDSTSWTIGSSWSVGIMDVTTFQQVGTLTGTIPPSFDMNASSYTSASGIAWSPDGLMLAVVVDTHVWLYTMALNGAGWQAEGALILDVAVGSVPLWSPDGYSLALFSHKYAVVHDLRTRQSVALTSASQVSTIAAVTWSGDSRRLTAVDDNNISSTWILNE